ncbi:hypothetical protein LSCM1_06469 [Leishmania martiniquensis]|uniref:Nucleosome assembly protein n=1 Tax=Leishmania martiniquensis TaxID=1580590 RepID=A0A836H5S7_9TRYP|nr:hypothetical protein LSCM1_06469 [Leishmania martiniquensis]
MEKAKEIQARLDNLQQEMHAKVEACDLKHSKEKNSIFAARRATIAALIAEKELPANFWALALIALLRMKDMESATTPHFLGPYDELLLKTYLEDIEVVYTEKGHRITLRFKPNPFFEESELWAESVERLSDETDEEDEAPPGEESWEFSGVTWKDGHGPQLDGEEEEAEGENGAPGSKRPHPSSDGMTASASSSTQGPSVLEVFSEMPPHPEDDAEMDEEDDDAIADAIEEWESEMDDRKLLLRMIELFVHYNPVSALRDGGAALAGAGNGEAAAAKKAKVE